MGMRIKELKWGKWEWECFGVSWVKKGISYPVNGNENLIPTS